MLVSLFKPAVKLEAWAPVRPSSRATETLKAATPAIAGWKIHSDDMNV
jgi:hypothetical protein